MLSHHQQSLLTSQRLTAHFLPYFNEMALPSAQLWKRLHLSGQDLPKHLSHFISRSDAAAPSVGDDPAGIEREKFHCVILQLIDIVSAPPVTSTGGGRAAVVEEQRNEVEAAIASLKFIDELLKDCATLDTWWKVTERARWKALPKLDGVHFAAELA